MTSIPETSIGLNAVKANEPEIFIGNLLGGMVVLFLLIIPVFGILGNGVKLNHDLGDRNLLLSLVYILLPILLLVDGSASVYDGVILILFYVAIVVLVYRRRGIKEEILSHLHKTESLNMAKELAFIVLGIIIILFASNILVNGIEFFANRFQLSELVLSLLILSIGTNIPELSLAIRSAYKGGKDVAFGNYLGSAVANALVLGVLLILNGGAVVKVSIIGILIAMVLGISLFYIFARSKDYLSRRESLVLLLGYVAFVIYEMLFKI
jgi:cation:H+ antiporter